MKNTKEQYSFLEKQDEQPEELPSKDSQKTTPRNKKRALTHVEKVGRGLTKAEVKRAKQEAAGQLGFDFFSLDRYLQPYLPGLLHMAGRMVTNLKDLASFKDAKRIPQRMGGAA